MNKSKLRTDFICVATSGYSVDGRQITSQELHEMAKNYDPNFYTANLWPDHKRWINLGQVLELKAEDQDNGETKLYAVISPSEHLINWNKEGQYLFTSVEIVPNFRNSGENYLFGLGVTDTPASVGTDQLNFNIKIPQNTLISENFQVNFGLKNEEELNQEQRSFFNVLKAFFTQNHSNNDNNNNEEQTMNEKQFNQLIEAVNGLSSKIDQSFSAKQADVTPVQETEQTAEKGVVTTEQFNQLIETVKNLEKQFNQMTKEVTAVPNGEPAVTNTNRFNLKGF
ncbi:capsid scaffolding serine peptidase GPO [Volucribacter psittacicida]|uniref:Capsid scaffolding serine peptidase GPO n=1 Tax=Volucribacter psittacicida TaxID=203482 RepID=A0A4R1G539_9PAST|nr:GPO family capsid scaffolding protein [Volucribacter psittacicida]TCJ98821.1 capsid scaffolding serine peptidase GPO [Volucribacter psittacicida]